MYFVAAASAARKPPSISRGTLRESSPSGSRQSRSAARKKNKGMMSFRVRTRGSWVNGDITKARTSTKATTRPVPQEASSEYSSAQTPNPKSQVTRRAVSRYQSPTRSNTADRIHVYSGG